MLGRGVSEARACADYSGVTRVGIDNTARARGQRCVSVMDDVGGRRVVAGGRDRGASDRLCVQLEERGGDRRAITEVARDTASSCSLGCADAMHGAVLRGPLPRHAAAGEGPRRDEERRGGAGLLLVRDQGGGRS